MSTVSGQESSSCFGGLTHAIPFMPLEPPTILPLNKLLRRREYTLIKKKTIPWIEDRASLQTFLWACVELPCKSRLYKGFANKSYDLVSKPARVKETIEDQPGVSTSWLEFGTMKFPASMTPILRDDRCANL